MKRIFTLFIFLTIGTRCFSQGTEFYQSGNGLIYADSTIEQLKHIVKTQNIKFRSCAFGRDYQSKFQTKGHYIFLEKVRVSEARKDMDAGISFEDLLEKYKPAVFEKDLLVVKFSYKGYNDKDVVEFRSMGMGNGSDHVVRFDDHPNQYQQPVKGKWIYNYYNATDGDNGSVEAFYFAKEFSQQSLPEVYSRMVQYADCMVDTTAEIFHKKAHKVGVRFKREESGKLNLFLNYVSAQTHRPVYTRKDADSYDRNYKLWDSLRFKKIDSLKNKDERRFTSFFIDAVKEVIFNGDSNDEFDEYVSRYDDKKTALELKRNRIVVGGCSQDDSPRIHALNIAKLSAETVNWEIFLRSHLDIMNDRFERVSDGSYAWQRRKTYIKELEVLEIDVPDLLFGISLRIENPSNNHYYGNIGRLGRALSESMKAHEMETEMLRMIADQQLDDYNRVLIYYLFLNYNANLEEKERQSINKAKLILATNTLPKYLSDKIKK